MSINVLHVDDDQQFGALVSDFLEREDEFTVETSLGVSAGLTHIEQTDVDCVVSDYDMPAVDGLEFLKEVRTIDPDLPFILFTGTGSEETASRAINEGVTDYIQKNGRSDKFDVLSNSVRKAVSYYRNKRELSRSQSFVERVLKLSPAAIMILDEAGGIMRVNDRAEDLLDLSTDELTDRAYDSSEWDIVDEDGDSIPTDALPFRQVLETGETVSDVEHGFKRPDGRVVWVSVNAAPLWDEGGTVENVIVVLMDITQQQKREQALKETQNQFEGFSSVLSHDLGNIFQIAHGRLELARETGDLSHLDEAEQALDRSVSMLEELTTVMRSGTFVSDITDVNVSEVSQSAWETQETDAGMLNAESFVIRADEEALLRMLENLIRNTLEHGSETVSVRIGRLPNGFYVEDDGPGIPEDDRETVFDPGYTTKSDGTGFGLVSTKQIVIAHGWEITVTEGPDGGARFEITGVAFPNS